MATASPVPATPCQEKYNLKTQPAVSLPYSMQESEALLDYRQAGEPWLACEKVHVAGTRDKQVHDLSLDLYKFTTSLDAGKACGEAHVAYLSARINRQRALL